MKRWTTTKTTVAGVLVACLLCCATAEAKKGGGGGGGGATHSIIPFDAGSTDSVFSDVNDLNDVGHAVGWVHSADEYPSYHLDLASGVYTLLPGDATAINNLGNIVGNTNTQGGGTEPNLGYYMSSLTAQPVILPPLAGNGTSRAWDINDDQIIVGNSAGVAVAWRAVVDTAGNLVIDGPVPLHPLDGDDTSGAFKINDPIVGPFQAVGMSHRSPTRTAVLWSITLNPDGTLAEPAAAVSLGTLGLWENGYSEATSINGFGDVAGISDWHPFIRPFDGVIQSLNVPRNTQWGTANDINDLGISVGWLDIHKVRGTNLSGSNYFAYLWQADGTYIDLMTQIDSSSGWGRLWKANQINNDGVIAGKGLYGDRDLAFIMTPN
jgi:hypothetical protein